MEKRYGQGQEPDLDTRTRLIMRILITGPECSGKSTLAEQLSQKLQIPWFPEYARTYLEEYGPQYNQADILTIGQTHHQLLHSFTPDQPLILDTYLLNLLIWSEYKYDQADAWILEETQKAQFDHILLLSPDLDWQQDGLRESKGQREELFDRYLQKLKAFDMSYQIIKGQGQERLSQALISVKSSS